MYGKIFRQIYNSSIANNWKTRVVFMDLIVLADSDGVVDMTVEALSRITNIPIDMVKEAVSELELNDPESRSTELDGRRIVKLDSSRSWGWKIVNYERYRNTHTESDRRENSYYGSTTKNSYVYYAVSGNEVKIGCSVNPWSRVYELKTGRPDIVLAAVENGGKDVEIERHRQFSRHLINREWFRLDGDLKSFIEKLEQEHLDSKLRKSNSSKNSSEIVADPSPSPCTYRSSSLEGGTGGNEVEFPKGFPITVDDAIRDASTSPYPKQFVIDTWNRAASRGGRDHRDVPIRRWTQHLATIWGYEQSRGKGSASNETNSRNNQRSNSRNDGTYNDGVAPMYAKAAVSGMSDVPGVQDSLRPPT